MPLYSPEAQAFLPLKKKEKSATFIFKRCMIYCVLWHEGWSFFFFFTNLKPRHQFMQAFYMNAVGFIHQEGG